MHDVLREVHSRGVHDSMEEAPHVDPIADNLGLQTIKGPATRNDIVDDIVDDPSSTMVFNVAKIASARALSAISLTKSLRMAGP